MKSIFESFVGRHKDGRAVHLCAEVDESGKTTYTACCDNFESIHGNFSSPKGVVLAMVDSKKYEWVQSTRCGVFVGR